MSEPSRPGPGRPRDESIDSRILDAALQVYATGGLSGFTVEMVAKVAGCSRPAVNARFPTREALLLRAVRSFDARLEIEDVGSARDQLVAVARQLTEGLASTGGMATFRIVFDSLEDPELRAEWETINGVRLECIEQILARAVLRSELPADVRSAELLHCLVGAMMAKAVYAQLGGAEEYLGAAGVEEIVDFLLARAV